MSDSTKVVKLLYGTKLGRLFFLLIQKSGIDKIVANFLWTAYSRPLIKWYIKRHNIPLEPAQIKSFKTFRDFFVRTTNTHKIDMEPGHLISPCDGYLSAYRIQSDSSFSIKNSYYRLCDLLQDNNLSKNYIDGDCLIFRLCASDYHHYCYIDDGFQGKNNFIPGQLHSVQPIACETYPVYTLNRRSWTLLTTEHFGPVIQTEIGAFIVGGIVNERENARFRKGMEKGHFELSGSTIVLLFKKDKICLLPHIAQQLTDGKELRVEQGMWIGAQKHIEKEQYE